MPPLASHKTLTDAEKDVVRRWIEQGAQWQEQWAFKTPVRTPLPPVKNTEWVRNAIDRFVLARMEAAGLAPAPESDRRTLARRLALDLTGLPPAPADVEAFVNDQSKDYYDRYVDRLMASGRWGEHRARYWLDAARYADTHGIHVDNYREMWPYRDWVIKAFNGNMPFSQFTVEQIAGDLLPNRTLDQQIASGFHRCNVTTNEAGVIIDEVEAIYAKDRVDTTGTVFLGLTVGCATCHDHKFDPIAQRDFYSMAAFFRNTTQNAMDGNIPDTPPVIVVPSDEDRPRWSRLAEDEQAAHARMDARRAAGPAEFASWLDGTGRRNIKAPVDAAAQVYSLDPASVTLAASTKLGAGREAERKAVHFEAKTGIELPNVAAVDAGKPFSVSALFLMPKGDDAYVVASQSDGKDKGRGWVMEVLGRVIALRITADDGRSIQIRAGHLEQLKPGTWNHVVATYDGTREQPGMTLLVNGKTALAQGGDSMIVLKGSINNGQPLRLGHDSTRGLAGGALAELRIYNRILSAEEARLDGQWAQLEASREKAAPALNASEREALLLHYLNTQDAPYRALVGQLAALRDERRAMRRRGAITHVMQERSDRQPMAHILYRGMYDQPRDKVEPAVPSVLPPMTASMPRNRLGLAQWLVDPANPLVSRVTVNRFWQELFGTGLVKTSEDFGSQGTAPTHPELLDWLAVDFRESGWDVKRLFKLMVSSATYRQSAQATEKKLKEDPENKLLARGPRFRMDGEMIRDYALASAGLLSPRLGGPSVKPYQPEGVWEAVAMLGSNTRFYKRDEGDKLYRRSLYTFWKRSAPPAAMEIFNAPTRENCSVRRERTNTPLQALVTMNDVQFVEAARRLAESAMQAAPGDVERQIGTIAERLLARPLAARERDVARRAYVDFLRHYDSNQEDARKLLAAGEIAVDGKLPNVPLAALTMLSNQFMNLDEVLAK
ncbi:MAG: DUF1553 domain-containing protein [Acidobacteria bacterium]|nr:DUF1553 domain-containing protein [Acidobacteriota bacterium]